MPLSPEQQLEVDELIRKAKSTRSSHQGILRGYITHLQTIIHENDSDRQAECQDMCNKLVLQKKKHKEVADEAIHVMTIHGLSVLEVEDKIEAIEKDVNDIYQKVNDWLLMKAEEPYSSAYDQLNTTVTETLEHVIEHGSDESDKQVEALTRRLAKMKKQLDELDDARYEISSLKDSLRAVEEDRQKDADQYQQQLHSLQATVSQEKSENDRLREAVQTSTPRPDNRRSTMNFSGLRNDSRGAMEQEDFFAISQIVAQSNSEMMKHVLDRSVDQHKTFYQSLQTPKVELKKFTGEYTAFHAFLSRFDDLVGNTDCNDSVKLNTLMQSCGPTVLKHIECCNYKTSEEGYTLAREILKKKYGNPFLVSQAWVDKMLEYPRLKQPEDVLLFASELRSCYESLLALGFLSDMENTVNMKEIVNKIPTYMQHRWRKHNHDSLSKGKKATLLELINIITSAAEEQADPTYGAASLSKLSSRVDKSTKDVPKASVKKKGSVNMTQTTTTSTSSKKPADVVKRKIKCSFCSEEHYPRLCPSFQNKSPKERLQMVRDKRLCLLCLNPFHSVKTCNLKWTCQEEDCNKRHNTTLHQAFEVEEKRTSGNQNSENSVAGLTADTDDDESVAYLSDNSGECTLHSKTSDAYSLPIIPVHVEGNGCVEETNVLMDTGATLTFVKKSFVERIGLKSYDSHTLTMTSMTDTTSFASALVNFNLKPIDNNAWVTAYGVSIVDELPVPDKYVKRIQCLEKWEHLSNLNIAVSSCEQVEILVGQSNAKFFKRKVEVYGKGGSDPYAVRTPLGWMIMGHHVQLPQVQKIADPQPVMVCTSELSLESKLDRMWQLDVVPDVKIEDPINVRIEKLWEKEARVVDGHLELPIPFKRDPPCMPNNRAVVEKRMESLKRRMQKDPIVQEKCMETMQNDFDKGYAEIAPEEPNKDYLWYVPIQPVITYTEKRMGKCRLVGDISCTHQGRCLNEEVHPGPNKTSSLYDMLLMFRKYRIAITGDLKEMFNQVRVPERQRDCLRFLWWLHGLLNPPTECRMKTQMFGGTWCPSICQYALEWVAKNPQGKYEQEIIDTVLKHFYVDDMLRSIWEEDLGYRLLMGVRELLQEIGFDMNKLGSSSLAILQQIPEEMRAKEYKEVTFDLHEGVTSAALGSVWKPGQDEFAFKSIAVDKPATKRGVLSVTTSLFDPMGLLAPFILRAKCLIQELCKEKLGWDDVLPAIYNKTWTTWIEELPTVQLFSIPRWIGMSKDPDLRYTLHVFTDASTRGYGAVIYLVVEKENGDVLRSSLVTSKAKVTPIKPTTIPRLELSACVLGVKMERNVRECLGDDLQDSCYWTDSTIALWYINGQAWRFKTFVSNRVGYIQERTEGTQWYYVPTGENVADYVSRGLSAVDMVSSVVWKEGPLFLQNIDKIPQQPELVSNDKDPEIKKRKEFTFMIYKHETDEDYVTKNKFLSQYSKWDKMICHMCIWHRIAGYLKTRKYSQGYFTVDERRKAELSIYRLIQETSLTKEQKQSRIFQKLFPYSEDGVYRVGGRLQMTSYEHDVKHPPILPSSEYTKVFIRNIHERGGHCGVDRTYLDVKKKVWLLGGKRTVKGAISDCVLCDKMKSQTGQQIMSPLPKFRAEKGSVPFDIVGVDYFGPMHVKVNRGTQKRYVCIFVDMKIRAAHVEVVHDMTTAAFIMALIRFIARRGRPSMIISDNGSNFVGARRELKAMFQEFDQEKIGNTLAEHNVKWQFNTPLASHHGGAWERLIRTFRRLFMAVAGSQRLNDESLLTFAATTEQMMNSRPLVKVTEDIDDESVLTPEHLINQRAADGIPGDFDTADALRSRWKQVLSLSEKFWKKWIKVYVQTLQLRHKWHKPTRDLKPGDIVLMKDESVHRLKWPLGRILETFPGKDGHVRSAKVKTQRGDFQRPISKLVRLECG